MYNHRHLHERLSREIARSRRLGRHACLVMADLDHLKQVNDRLGHQVDDEALRSAAATLCSGVREVDLVGRYGGEEFILVLVNCQLEAGRQLANRLRLAIAQRAPGMTDLELINSADQALYQAKHSGRNSVEFFVKF